MAYGKGALRVANRRKDGGWSVRVLRDYTTSFFRTCGYTEDVLHVDACFWQGTLRVDGFTRHRTTAIACEERQSRVAGPISASIFTSSRHCSAALGSGAAVQHSRLHGDPYGL